MPDPPRAIPPHGGYRALRSYQVAEIIYDGTVMFCRRFLNPRSRTVDQMVQAARSGKQNIAEGRMNSGTSRKSELKLTGVARGSLEELLNDYQDYIRQNRLRLWGRNHAEARAVRAIGRSDDRSYAAYAPRIERGSAEVAANTLICLTHQANFLLDNQLHELEARFLDEGGFSENLYRARAARRRREDRVRLP
ncbi:four helix bundle protein [bacterium]|nr:four helix bundle protein [bacterium]